MRTIIFDKDGTLINFNKLWIPWIRNNISRLNLESETDVLKIYKSIGVDPINQKLSDDSLLSHASLSVIRSSVADIIGNDKMINWSDDFSTECQYVPIIRNIKEVFDFLKLKNEFRLVLSTNDSEKGAKKCLKELEIDYYFDLIVGYDSCGFTSKPDSKNILKICDILETEPRKSIMISDTSSDMIMAKKSGSKGVGVLSGIGKYEELRLAGSSFIIRDISEIPTLLSKI